MLNKVRNYIKEKNILPLPTSSGEGSSCMRLLVALSGGADSVCLLRILIQLGYKVEAAHCNFRLRGEESDRDEIFCETLCKLLNVPFHRIHFDTREYAELHHMSIEMAARELRYSFFEQLRLAIGAEDIVVAHHRDDNIETLLLNIIRGTGIRGLGGMKPRNGHIVRPFLNVSRDEILVYLDAIHQDYITDSSNLIDDVQRNKIRLNIIPLLKEVNPAAFDNIQQSIGNISEAVKVYDSAMEESKSLCFKDNVISVPKLKEQPSPECTLFEIANSFGVPSEFVREIYKSLDASSGRIWQWNDMTIAKDRDTLIIDKTPDAFNEKKIPEAGTYDFIEFTIRLAVVKKKDDFVPSRENDLVTLDADRVQFPLILRQTLPGDSFRPYGMIGRKLVSDYLTDIKTNWFEKHRQKVLVDNSGEIIWVMGRRVSQKVSVTSDTINIMEVRYFTDEK